MPSAAPGPGESLRSIVWFTGSARRESISCRRAIIIDGSIMRLPACLLSICVTLAGPRTGQEFRHPIHHRRWREEGDLLSRRILPGAELVARREIPASEHAGQALAAL